jgi:hypothetical protein
MVAELDAGGIGRLIAAALDHLGELGEAELEPVRTAVLERLLGDSGPYVEEGVRLLRTVLNQANQFIEGGRRS